MKKYLINIEESQMRAIRNIGKTHDMSLAQIIRFFIAYGIAHRAEVFSWNFKSPLKQNVIPKWRMLQLRTLDDKSVKKILYERHKIKIVPACHECNCALGAKYFETIDKRKKYVKQRIRRKYYRILNIPEWEDYELAQMGPIMQIHINQGLAKQDRIKARLLW